MKAGRLDVRGLQDALADPLDEFVREAGVSLAVLINRNGQVLAQHGFERVGDLAGVASLAAGIHASSRALARQLGEDRFGHLHHTGRSRGLFLGHFDSPAGPMILLSVFEGRSSSIGLVRLFFEEFVSRVGRLGGVEEVKPMENPDDFERELEVSLNRFFNDLVGG